MFIKINLWHNLNWSCRSKLLIETLIVPEHSQRTSPGNVFCLYLWFGDYQGNLLCISTLKPKDIIKLGRMHF